MSEPASANEQFTSYPATKREGLGRPVVAAIAVGALLLGLIAGFLINQARVSDAQDERDRAKAELSSTKKDLESTTKELADAKSTGQAQLAAAQAALAACKALVDTTTQVADRWDEFVKTSTAFNATAVGSAEEAQLAAQLDAMERSMTGHIGTVRAHLANCKPPA